jgi:hypothetical protein
MQLLSSVSRDGMIRLPNNNGIWVTGAGSESKVEKPAKIRFLFRQHPKNISFDSLEPDLDAAKPYAHSAREHGRFGSHPSHDGFDDESES